MKALIPAITIAPLRTAAAHLSANGYCIGNDAKTPESKKKGRDPRQNAIPERKRLGSLFHLMAMRRFALPLAQNAICASWQNSLIRLKHCWRRQRTMPYAEFGAVRSFR